MSQVYLDTKLLRDVASGNTVLGLILAILVFSKKLYLRLEVPELSLLIDSLLIVLRRLLLGPENRFKKQFPSHIPDSDLPFSSVIEIPVDDTFCGILTGMKDFDVSMCTVYLFPVLVNEDDMLFEQIEIRII